MGTFLYATPSAKLSNREIKGDNVMLYYQNAHHNDVIFFFTFYGNHQSIVKIVPKIYLIKALKLLRQFTINW